MFLILTVIYDKDKKHKTMAIFLELVSAAAETKFLV